MSGGKWKLKLLYVMKMFLEETDEENTLTVPQIIKKLEEYGIAADRRTVYDDIETLKDFGMDIIMERTKTFNYFLGNRDFQLPELKLLVDAVQYSRFITEAKSKELIKKLEKLTSKNYGGKLERQVYIAERAKSANENVLYNIDIISDAIEENKQISFVYSEFNLDKKLVPRRNGERYFVSPYMLIWDDENYYMAAYYERYDNIANFRVDKMSGIVIEEEYCKPKNDDWNPADYAKKTFGMFPGEQQTVTLEFDQGLIGVLVDRFGSNVVMRKNIDFCEADIKVSVSPVFYAWLCQFGGRMRIKRPESVREGMRKLLNELEEIYV